MQQQQPPKPPVYLEVIVTLRKTLHDEQASEANQADLIKVYRHAIWQLQFTGGDTILVISETLGDKESHIFPWQLVARVDTVPMKIELVGPGAEAS